MARPPEGPGRSEFVWYAGGKITSARPHRGPGHAALPGRSMAPAKPGPLANLRDHADLVGLGAAVTLRDLELDPLSLFEGAVTIRLDRREMDENVLATVYGNEA